MQKINNNCLSIQHRKHAYFHFKFCRTNDNNEGGMYNMNTNSGRACEREGDWERCELYSWLNGLVNVSWFLMIRVLCTMPMTSSGRGARTGRGEEYGSKSGPFALMSLVRGLAEFTVVRMAWVRLRREEKKEREGEGKKSVHLLAMRSIRLAQSMAESDSDSVSDADADALFRCPFG